LEKLSSASGREELAAEMTEEQVGRMRTMLMKAPHGTEREENELIA
jgi:hypothetical protein